VAEAGLRWLCPRCGAHARAAGRRLDCAECGLVAEPVDGVWKLAPGLSPGRFSADRRRHLTEIEHEHFWFPPRRRLLAALARRCPRAHAAIDLGCGNGGFLPSLAALYPSVVGVDAYPESLAAARRCAPEAALIQADACRVPLAGNQFDLVSALDVLEHVAPESLLAEARRLLRPGGWLLLSVPAAPVLWSALDVAAGHRCRYTRERLRAELAAVGFAVRYWTHYQFLLFPLALVARRFAGEALHRLERRPPAVVGALLGAVNSLEVRASARLPLPIGSSLCALAERLP
jgi:SAM-dependent methyltransferase